MRKKDGACCDFGGLQKHDVENEKWQIFIRGAPEKKDIM
jgi:hypothetical protein